jgi:hypothetical protein
VLYGNHNVLSHGNTPGKGIDVYVTNVNDLSKSIKNPLPGQKTGQGIFAFMRKYYQEKCSKQK